jgi:hypothetical protein
LAATAANAALAYAWLHHHVPTAAILGLQAAISCLLVFGMCGIRRTVYARDLALLATLLLFGPFGGIAVLFQELARSIGQRRMGTARADATGRPLNQAEMVFAAICQNRRPRAPGSDLASFVSAFESDSRTRQNAALAAISRNYQPEMLPALIDALGSKVAAIRVQAAAVFAKYRTSFGNRARELISAGVAVQDAQEALARAAACREVAAGGFVDGATVEALEALATALEAEAGQIASAAQTNIRLEDHRVAPGAPSPLGRYSCGGMR